MRGERELSCDSCRVFPLFNLLNSFLFGLLLGRSKSSGSGHGRIIPKRWACVIDVENTGHSDVPKWVDEGEDHTTI